MCRLICVFVVRIWHKQVFSWHGSNEINPFMPNGHFQCSKLKSQFPVLGVSGVFFIFILFWIKIPVCKQTMIILRFLIWGYTVCQGLINGMLGINELREHLFCFDGGKKSWCFVYLTEKYFAWHHQLPWTRYPGITRETAWWRLKDYF